MKKFDWNLPMSRKDFGILITISLALSIGSAFWVCYGSKIIDFVKGLIPRKKFATVKSNNESEEVQE